MFALHPVPGEWVTRHDIKRGMGTMSDGTPRVAGCQALYADKRRACTIMYDTVLQSHFAVLVKVNQNTGVAVSAAF